MPGTLAESARLKHVAVQNIVAYLSPAGKASVAGISSFSQDIIVAVGRQRDLGPAHKGSRIDLCNAVLVAQKVGAAEGAMLAQERVYDLQAASSSFVFQVCKAECRQPHKTSIEVKD